MNSTDQLVLIDTFVWVHCLRHGTPPAMAKHVRDLLSAGRVATMGMIVLEVIGGARSNKEHDELRNSFSLLRWIPTSNQTWFTAAKDAYDLRRKGVTAPFTDILIARAALDAGCTLLHTDKHFPHIARVTGLNAESI